MSKNWPPALYKNAQAFAEMLTSKNYSFFSGVPCSLLGTLIEHIDKTPHFEYVPSVREDAAMGLASGAYLAGRKACVLMQNSGFGYSLNVFTSLNMIYKIPLLVLISYRGYLGPSGGDAPEHIIMGNKIQHLLESLEIPYFVPGCEDLLEKLELADRAACEKKIPAVLLIREKIFG